MERHTIPSYAPIESNHQLPGPFSIDGLVNIDGNAAADPTGDGTNVNANMHPSNSVGSKEHNHVSFSSSSSSSSSGASQSISIVNYDTMCSICHDQITKPISPTSILL